MTPPLDAPFLSPLVRGALLASLAGVSLLVLAFSARQRRPGRIGGPIALSKLLWLGTVVALALPLPTILALAPSVVSSLRLALGLFAGSFALRAGLELWLMYGPGQWRPVYGIAHDLLSMALAGGGALLTADDAVTPADLVAWGALVLLFGLMAFETVFAVLHHRAVGEGGTTGADAVWFAPPGDPRFRASRRLTVLALALILPGAALVHLLGLWPPDRAQGPAAGALALPRPAVIAHRGASWIAPEATLPAYVVARRVAPDFIEVDVQRTRDGVLVAFHDDTVERTTNARALYPTRARSGPGAFTWPELARLDAGSWFNLRHPDRARPAFEGLRILRFEEVAALVAAAAGASGKQPGLYIETKSPARYPGVEADLLRALHATGWLTEDHQLLPGRQVILQSFDPRSLDRFRELAPGVPRVLLVDAHAPEAAWAESVRAATELDAQLGASGFEGTPAYTRRAHEAGRWVHHYTLNQPWEMALMWRFGSDGFFTDRADVGLRAMGRPAISAETALEDWLERRGGEAPGAREQGGS